MMVRIQNSQGQDDGSRLALQARPASTAHVRSARLLSPAFTPAACAIVVACAGITAVLGILFAHHTQPTGLDTAVYNWIQSAIGGGHRRGMFLFGLSELGGFFLVGMMLILLVIACLMTGRPRGALLTAVAVPLAPGSSEFLIKHIVDRTYNGALSFPSGHTTGICVVATVVAILLLGPQRPPQPAIVRGFLVAAGAALTVVVAMALVVTDRHYFTDTIGGAAVGVGVALATALVIDRFPARSASTIRPPAGDPGPPAE
jgi:membrane-associated phospholipid phosphatase